MDYKKELKKCKKKIDRYKTVLTNYEKAYNELAHDHNSKMLELQYLENVTSELSKELANTSKLLNNIKTLCQRR